LEGHPVVARDREADGLLPAREDVDEDQRVRVLTADAVELDALHGAGVQRGEEVGRQDVPVIIGAALQAHQQDVHRADGRAARDDVRAADAADLRLHVVGESARDQDEGSEDTAQDVTGFADDRRAAVSPEHLRLLRTGLSPLGRRLLGQV